jgi:5-bromo-4-chloroindolyl phosphate hydrolysis protein
MNHLRFNNGVCRRKHIYITSAVVSVLALAASVTISASSANSQKKSMKSAAQDAENRAKALEQEAAEAEVAAEQKAKEDARKRIRSVTQTIYTSPLGVSENESAQTSKPTLLGS